MEAIICGIDPGLGIMGYAVLSGSVCSPVVVDAGACRFDRQKSLAQRLADVERDIASILDEHKPAVLAVEELYSHYKHPRTSILMGHARGVILMAGAQRGIEVRSYAATRIKRFLTGNGRATKAQMQRAIQTTLGLSELPDPPDVADALAIALCCIGEMAHQNQSAVELLR